MEQEYSYVSKKAVVDAYGKTTDFIWNEDCHTEEAYFTLEREIAKLKIAMPVIVADEIQEFIDNQISMLVYGKSLECVDGISDLEDLELDFEIDKVALDDIGSILDDNEYVHGYFDEETGEYIEVPDSDEMEYSYELKEKMLICEIGAEFERFGETVLRPFLLDVM